MKGRPRPEDYPAYFETYVSKVSGDEILTTLAANNLVELFSGLTAEQWDYRYAPGKWNLKESLIHILDTERIFGYRALRISRNDKSHLQGFEQDDYVPFYEAENRSPESIIAEFKAVRRATLAMYNNFSEDHYHRKGIASGKEVSVLALAFMTAGHEIHHLELTNQKYLT